MRKIIRECKKVLDYLAVAEVIESMEDLVQFVRDLSPCLTKVSREVDARQKELTHQVLYYAHYQHFFRQANNWCQKETASSKPLLIKNQL